MGYHTPPVERKLKKSIEKMIISPISKKKKKVKVFETLPNNSHKMKGGSIMSGSKHTKTSKIIGKLKQKKM